MRTVRTLRPINMVVQILQLNKMEIIDNMTHSCFSYLLYTHLNYKMNQLYFFSYKVGVVMNNIIRLMFQVRRYRSFCDGCTMTNHIALIYNLKL